MATVLEQVLERINQSDQRTENCVAQVRDRVGDVEKTLAAHCAAEEGYWDNVKSLRAVVDELKTSITDHHASVKRDKETVDKLEHVVFGNGKVGLSTRTDRIENFLSYCKWGITAVVIPSILYAGYTLMQWGIHKLDP